MNSAYGKYFTKAALMWAACFVILFLVHMFVLTPQKKDKAQFEKRLAEKKQIYDFALKASQEENKVQLSQEIDQLRSELKDLTFEFEDSANLTFDISQIATEKAVNSFSITAKKDSGGGKGKGKPGCIYESNIDIGFSVVEFNQFAALLNALERHQPVIFVDKFTINRSGRSGSGHQVKMNLSVFVRRTQAAKKTDEPLA